MKTSLFKPFDLKCINTFVMENNLEHSDWMNEAPYLAGLRAKSPFSVPEGYFEGLSEHINQAIYLDQLKAQVPDDGFSVPENYFETLGEDIHAKLTSSRLKEMVPQDGYILPGNYFEQLGAKILAKTVIEPIEIESASPIVAIPARKETGIVRLWHSKLLKYASAACFVIIGAAGFYFYPQSTAQQNMTADIANEQMLFDIDESTIIDHINTSIKEQEQPIVADAELENYILTNYSQSDIASDL